MNDLIGLHARLESESIQGHCSAWAAVMLRSPSAVFLASR